MEKKQEKKQPKVEKKAEEDVALSEVEQKELELALLKEQLETAQAEIAELKDQMLRNRADLENTRKRLIRDKEEAVKYANSSLIKDLLEPLDDFDRALEAAESTEDYKKVHDGVVMVSSQIFGILERNWGLERIVALGNEFDPDEHEAYMVVPDDSLEHEMVLEEFSNGYKLHGRVLRPTKVKVGKPNI
ncbi:MAG: nucleotide exchange factor GrpE [Sphaerochaeta sp.]|jgi:molecular chaperone GrpE|nr:nucleotide exchange factor GrpE [Spirochaetales bacterium]